MCQACGFGRSHSQVKHTKQCFVRRRRRRRRRKRREGSYGREKREGYDRRDDSWIFPYHSRQVRFTKPLLCRAAEYTTLSLCVCVCVCVCVCEQVCVTEGCVCD